VPGVLAQSIRKLHDHRQRSWRHLDFFQFEAYVHCSLPRVACSVCGATTQLSVPWAREGSRFTLMFEALALTLAREMPVSACARILRCADNTVWRQIDAHVCLARAQESYANVKVIGIDETSCAKGHSYITLVHDLDKARLIHATPGKDASTVQAIYRRPQEPPRPATGHRGGVHGHVQSLHRRGRPAPADGGHRL
jgi:transposase